MTLNVLLMLATTEEPDPREETKWHARNSIQNKVTYLATTKALNGLVPEQSTVALFGNADIGNEYLGKGRFVELVDCDSPRGEQILEQQAALYGGGHVPTNVRSWIGLKDVVCAASKQELAALGGTIRASGLSLTLANLPIGPARACVYFTSPGPI
jgi:hypothetical protein